MDQVNRPSTPIPSAPSSPFVRLSAQSPLSTQPGVRGAHSHLIERLKANEPHEIRFVADAADLDEVAEHLEKTLLPVIQYVGTVIGDVANVSNEIDRRYLEGMLYDMQSEIVGALRRGADQLRDAA